MNTTPHIISVSRRTDIPAFYWPWFMSRIRAGFACYMNPFGGQVHSVSLRPADVIAFVFWSRDYRPALEDLVALDRDYRFYLHLTITGLPRELEPHVPDTRTAVAVCRELAARFGPRRVLWRFDPIIVSNRTGREWQVRTFAALAAALAGATERCYFSFVDFYGKTRRNLARLQAAAGVACRDPAPHEKQALARELAGIAAGHGIQLYACCEDAVVGGAVHKAHCVDGALVAELFPGSPRVTAAAPTRAECGCVASRDIGAYDTCRHGCVYCYANGDAELAARRHARLAAAPDSPALSDDPRVLEQCARCPRGG